MDDSKVFKHGGSSGYNYHKCRCSDCVAWKKQQRVKERDSGASAAQQRNYRLKNAEKVRAREDAYREKRMSDPEKRAKFEEYQKNYATENAEQKRASTKAWRERDPHRAWVSSFCGTSGLRGAPVDGKTRQWLMRLDVENPPCAYCGAAWETVDHVIPISKGGDSSRKNLTPCCHSCNRSKHKLDPYVWAARVAARKALPSGA